MSNLVLMPGDPYGMGFVGGKEVIATSRAVAEMFGKRHDHVLRDVQNILAGLPKSGESDFGLRNFTESKYKNEQGKRQPMYLMTRDGFTLLVMGYSGAKALHFKVAYINRFNEMEKALADRSKAKIESRLLTDAIKSAHDPVKPYHFSNEMNMLLQVVTGKQAKQLKAERNLPETAVLRDYLTPAEIGLLQNLQPVAAYLNITNPDYKERKKLLQEYAAKLSVSKLQEAQ